MPAPILRLVSILGALALTTTLVAQTVPWPYGQAPTATELDRQVQEAVELDERETAEAFLEASEKGEDREHILIPQDRIDRGVYTLDQLFQIGDAFFSHVFRAEDGLGDGTRSTLQRVHRGVRGGLDTHTCAGCHSVGGADGAGTETQNAFLNGDGDRLASANVRNAPAVLGLGFVQALADEMTRELQGRRTDALREAAAARRPVTVKLETKDVSFGTLTAQPDGRIDTGGVVGISADLVVRPFGWKGSEARLRRFVEEAARLHFGVQSHVLAQAHRSRPDPAKLGDGPDWWDPDRDRVARELEEGSITAAAVYLTLLESPVIIPPDAPRLRERWSHGVAVFDTVGCAGCHRTELPLKRVVWIEKPDTTAGAGVEVHLLKDGDMPRSGNRVKLFSDLKRHDMGEALADAHDDPDGIPRSHFLTRPLWGVAESAPYLHDGRAGTLAEAILAHGGEAAAARDAYAALPRDAQADLQLFLLSLSRAPRLRIPR